MRVGAVERRLLAMKRSCTVTLAARDARIPSALRADAALVFDPETGARLFRS